MKPKKLSSNITAGVLPPTRTQKNITVNGNAQISTTQSKFGGAAGVFDGTGDYLYINNFDTSAAAMQGNFTIEAWARFNVLPGSQTGGGGNYMTLYFSQTAIAGSVEPYVLIDNDASNHPQVAIGLTNGAVASYATWTLSTTTISTNTWYHIALVRLNGSWKAYWGGVDMGTPGSLTNWPAPATVSPVGQYVNWAGWPQTGRGYWNGYLDEIRVSCVARYNQAFTPPTEAFVNDSGTLMLLHFDGSNGSTSITDDIS